MSHFSTSAGRSCWVPLLFRSLGQKASGSEKNVATSASDASKAASEAAPSGKPLSLYQRYFTRPVRGQLGEEDKPIQRRFALASRGSVVVAFALLLVLAAIIAAAVTVTLRRKSFDQQSTHPVVRPAILANFADPSIWYEDGVWYAYATNDAAGILHRTIDPKDASNEASNVQIATSSDFVNWDVLNYTHDPLPKVGAWAVQQQEQLSNEAVGLPNPRANVWAPAILRRPVDNQYILYYSANTVERNPKPDHPAVHCIGAAVSVSGSPAGPFRPENNTISCPVDQGGAIDPAALVDEDGTIYVTWKVDGNNIGNGGMCGNTIEPIVPTPIMLQKMHADGITPDGEPITILDRTASDGPLVEAPALVRSHEGIYFLFFSSGCTRAPTYDVRYATAKNVTGPYTRAQGTLLRTGNSGLTAPGSVGIAADEHGGYRMAFHARVRLPVGGVRAMYTTGLEFAGHSVRLEAIPT